MYGEASQVFRGDQRLQNRIANVVDDVYFNGRAESIDGILVERSEGTDNVIKLTFADNSTFVGTRDTAQAKLLLTLTPPSLADIAVDSTGNDGVTGGNSADGLRARDDGVDDGGQ